MESEDASLSKLMETRSTILEKGKENISTAQKKKNHYHQKSNCLQTWSKDACQEHSTLRAKRWKALLWLGPYTIKALL